MGARLLNSSLSEPKQKTWPLPLAINTLVGRRKISKKSGRILGEGEVFGRGRKKNKLD